MFNPDEPDPGPVALSSKSVVMVGAYGTVDWIVSHSLYATLPVGECDDLCNKTGDRIVGPYFSGLAQRLLQHAGAGNMRLADLDGSWSLETIQVECHVAGQISWQVPQGLWDVMPAERREVLIEMVKGLIHTFMEQRVCGPLIHYYVSKLALGDDD